MKLGTVLVVLLTGCLGASGAPTADVQSLVAANDAFAFKLLKEVAREELSKNIFISPYSASTVLQAVSCGATGQTRREMESVLWTSGMAPEALGAGNEQVAQTLNDQNKNVILTTANAIWYSRDKGINPAFLALNQKYFGATVAPVDFADPHCADVINAWASEKTHGRIPSIADGMIDPVSTRLFLANAVYFKGKWSDPFKPEDTKNHPFCLRGGGTKDIPMMNQSKTFSYRYGIGYQAVRLPYEGGNLGLYVFLPATNLSPEILLAAMNGDTWRRLTKPGFTDKEGVLMLPKFKMNYFAELTKTLQVMGMKRAFDDRNTDNFSEISDSLYISRVVQKAFIEVKEEGTEAAAVTLAGMEASGIPTPKPKPFEMIVDRPFMFLIEDDQTGTILFMGLIFDPQVN